MITKSRDLPIQDLYRNLQLEWISYYVRKNIYEREIDIKRFGDICEMKKEKIDRFELRNSAPSIFSSKEKLAKYLTEFYPFESEFPEFQYTPKNKETLSKWDKYHFFLKGSEVESQGKHYTITYNNPYKKCVGVEEGGKVVKLSYYKVRRDIFSIFENI